jgi:hypothetical protein
MLQNTQWKIYEVDVSIIGWKYYRVQYEIPICRYFMSKQMLCLLLMFHIFCLTNETKFEFVNKQYLQELMQTLK